jgi:hypothetical protein
MKKNIYGCTALATAFLQPVMIKTITTTTSATEYIFMSKILKVLQKEMMMKDGKK